MALESTKVLNLFYSYAHEDQALRDELNLHLSSLKHQHNIKTWSDSEMSPGTEWAQEIESRLHTAHLILLLISPHFMGSEYCYGIEMKKTLARHATGATRVLAILLHPVDWEGAPFSKLPVLPTDAIPISLWPNRDAAWQDVVKGIRLVVEELIRSSPKGRRNG